MLSSPSFRIGYTLGRQGEAEPVPEAGLRREIPPEAFARRASPLGTAVETPSFAPDVRGNVRMSVPRKLLKGSRETGAEQASSRMETLFDGARRRVLTARPRRAIYCGTATCPGRSPLFNEGIGDVHGQTTGRKGSREGIGVSGDVGEEIECC